MFVVNPAISGEIQHVFPSKNVAGLVSSWLTVPPTWKFHAITWTRVRNLENTIIIQAILMILNIGSLH